MLSSTSKWNVKQEVISFIELTTVIWGTWLWSLEDCPQSPCATVSSLLLFMTKRSAAPCSHFITHSNASAKWCMELFSLPDLLLAGMVQQTCKRDLTKVFQTVCCNFYFLFSVKKQQLFIVEKNVLDLQIKLFTSKCMSNGLLHPNPNPPSALFSGLKCRVIIHCSNK